jgi:hypothetical protein
MANDKGIKIPQVFMISHTPSRVSYNLIFSGEKSPKGLAHKGIVAALL